MSVLDNLSLGFATALTLQNLTMAAVGCTVGTLVGVLPGIGPLATIAMLLPLTYYFPPETALIMLAGMYYGAQYGGSTSAILVNLPGESSSAVTCIDGHQMAINGRGGAALATAALASFVAGTLSTFVVAFFAAPLAYVAVRFTAADYFSLMLFGAVGAVALSSGSPLKSVGMVLLGIMLGGVGTDLYTGTERYALGVRKLVDGIDFVPLAIGLFGVADIMANLMRDEAKAFIVSSRLSELLPSRAEFRAGFPAALRGSVIGSILGILPGGGATLASFASYGVEKKLSASPERFGRGAIEGVAGPEAANNAGAQTSFIPMLTLGIPSNPVMAVIIGALLIQGIVPGPDVLAQRPSLVWGLIASMWIGNVMLVIINLPLIGIWIRLLRIPYDILFPAIILFCCIGAYSLTLSSADIFIAIFFAVLGLALSRFDCPPAPLALGFIIGPMMEEHFRRAMLLSRGSLGILVTSPISLVLLLATLALAISMAVPSLAALRKTAFESED
ncbi:MAG: tripartite tricarboxylate transporter permease [Alphaproteobacteria bacterium]|nr:tripartite tricarboxylate transporter permease [Alphaproteobacteria bacterium]